MSRCRRLVAALALAAASGGAAAADAPATAQVPAHELVEYGLFGQLHLSRPSGAIAHTALLVSDRLLLIDAGAEYQCYASDITRTFPVNGRFSAEQRALYEIVLAAQLAAIDEVRAGRSFDAYHQAAVRSVTRGLLRLGLLGGTLERNLREHAYRKFYMHKTGHWLGLDVHDVGDYRVDGEFRVLEPGMVVTVEPGLYVAPDAKGVPAKFRGIGIRIEDDVVVTDGAPEVMSADVPKDAEAIQALMAAAG